MLCVSVDWSRITVMITLKETPEKPSQLYVGLPYALSPGCVNNS